MKLKDVNWDDELSKLLASNDTSDDASDDADDASDDEQEASRLLSLLASGQVGTLDDI